VALNTAFKSKHATRTRREFLGHTLHAGAGLWVLDGAAATAQQIPKQRRKPFDINALDRETGAGKHAATEGLKRYSEMASDPNGMKLTRIVVDPAAEFVSWSIQ
jgi:hypothetical protein